MDRKHCVGKGEIARYEQFLFFPVFSKDLHSRHVKTGLVWERVNLYLHITVLYHDNEKNREKNCVMFNLLSHNNPCFQCYIAITNILVLHTCAIRFHDAINCTAHMFTS